MLSKLSQIEQKKLITISTIIALALISWIVFSPKGLLKYFRLTETLETVKAENQKLEKENKELRQEVARLLNDPVYLEEIARKKYGLIKKNEIIFDFKKKKKRK